ncbi:MAG TPA: CoA transferase [Dehalococcoidales bacterium]|nr:CoA transferase [Dehalococcoidales bacterium]
MTTKQDSKSVLPPIRILDLTEGGCMLGGRLLGDAGADVIKIEPPGGSSSRIWPFYHNIQTPDKSLFWFAYNANKRGVTLDIRREEGRSLFKKLVKTADVVMESSEPGYMKSIGLGYEDLCQVKKDIIVTAITPFGQNGPKAHYAASALTVWASGGYLNACGDPDRAPVWITLPQTFLFGGCEGAIGSLAAYLYRLDTGEGQFIDVSMQEAAVSPNMNVLQMWDLNKLEFKRVGSASYVAGTGVKQHIYFKCKDGYVMILAIGGNDPYATSSEKLVQWMDKSGMAPDWLKKLNWWTDFNASTLNQATADRVGEVIEKFTLTMNKNDLYQIGAFEYKILIAPVSSAKDITEDIQLKARRYWMSIYHPELGEDIPYSGPFIRLSETPIQYRRRAPLPGENNQEIYGQELGLSQQELDDLKLKNII